MVEGLSQGDGPLFAPRNRPLYHQEVLADDPVAGEGAQGCDELLSWVCLRHGVVVGLSLAVLDPLGQHVDLLVDLRAVVVAVLTDAGHRVAHAGRMPRADASDLSETSVGLARQPCHAPTRDDALHTATLGHRNSVNNLVL